MHHWLLESITHRNTGGRRGLSKIEFPVIIKAIFFNVLNNNDSLDQAATISQ